EQVILPNRSRIQRPLPHTASPDRVTSSSPPKGGQLTFPSSAMWHPAGTGATGCACAGKASATARVADASSKQDFMAQCPMLWKAGIVLGRHPGSKDGVQGRQNDDVY